MDVQRQVVRGEAQIRMQSSARSDFSSLVAEQIGSRKGEGRRPEQARGG